MGTGANIHWNFCGTLGLECRMSMGYGFGMFGCHRRWLGMCRAVLFSFPFSYLHAKEKNNNNLVYALINLSNMLVKPHCVKLCLAVYFMPFDLLIPTLDKLNEPITIFTLFTLTTTESSICVLAQYWCTQQFRRILNVTTPMNPQQA